MIASFYIHGLGHFHPDNVIDNAFLEGLDIETNEEWILTRVGIHTRRTILPLDYIRETKNADVRAAAEAADYDNVETSRRAALVAIERAGITPRDIGMVVAGGCSPEMLIPSEACRVAAALDIEVPAVDINSACSSFGAQLHLLGSMSGLPPYVLVVNAENTTRLINYSDRSTAVLWGDGTAATVLSTQLPSRLHVTATSFNASPKGWNLVRIPRGDYFTQEGQRVQRFAIKRTTSCIREVLPAARERTEKTGGSVRFVGHQANKVMLEGVARRLGLEGEHHWYNVDRYGNTGAAGAPTVLSQHWDELRDGDSVVLAVVGSGLAWGCMHIEVG